MIIFLLLNLGLSVIPFVIYPGLDSREPKMAAALVFALTLGLVGIYQGKLKPIRNKWLLFLVGFLLINIWLCPKPAVKFEEIAIGSFWVWQVLSYVLIFFLMFATVSSVSFEDKQKDTIFKVMSYVGLVMAIYAILQFFKIDQFYTLSSANEALNTPSGNIGGTLGNPTIVAPFIAMIIPICLYLKKYWFSGIMVIAVLLTKSQVAIGALIVSLVFLQALRDKKTAIRIGILSLIFIVVGTMAYFNNPKIKSLVGDSGRFIQWKQIVKDVNSPIRPELKNKYPFTGLGLGSFKYIYHIKNKSEFHQAHNEYLEILYNTGIIGLALFLMSLWTILKGKIDRQRKFLLTSFVCIAMCAGGSFVFQLGPHLYYTLTILGLLNQREEVKC
jgi:hypothetical protein